MISFRNVTKAFGLRTALRNITFHVAAGELVAVVGPSGSGKTTLVNLLIGALLPTEGELFVDDIAVPKLNHEELQRFRRNLGVVFQDYKLLPKKTLLENVALAAYDQPAHIHQFIPELLDIVGIRHRAHAYPHELSGGEAQRAALARALIHRPSLIIADEPTGNLDAENEKAIMELFKRLHREGNTVVLTTHNLPLAQRIGCRLIHLRDGRLY